MDEQGESEAPETLTPRLKFTAGTMITAPATLDEEIPAFLQEDRFLLGENDFRDKSPESVANAPVMVSPSSASAPAKPTKVPVIVEETRMIAAQGQEPTDRDFDHYTVEDLKRQQEELAQKILEKQQEEKLAVIAQIVEVVKTYNVPLEELVEALGGLKVKRKGVKAEIKYRDPVSGVTWSGRGKEPAWIKGQDRRKFQIK
jgi:DNA-binding protein H-NS